MSARADMSAHAGALPGESPARVCGGAQTLGLGASAARDHDGNLGPIGREWV